MKRLFGIGVVWCGCALAWGVLGSTLIVRSGESSAALSPEVQELWGPEMVQVQPSASFTELRTVRTTRTLVDDAGQSTRETSEREEPVSVPVPLVASDVEVHLDLEHRRRGLVWFPTYTAAFSGLYTFRNDDAQARDVVVRFPLPSVSAVYDGFRVEDGERREVAASIGREASVVQDEWGVAPPGGASWQVRLEPGQTARYRVSFRTRGTDSWRYQMAHGTTRVSDFRLVVTTNFTDVDFPAGSLSPTEHGSDGDGWRGVWAFDSLIANRPIGIAPPSRINPGPLAARITFFAPVGLLFFFFVVAILAASQKRDLHPMHFFFLGCAFFAFHLLFAYLVDHLSIGASFALAAGTSVALVVSYARLFVGWRFALAEMGVSQLLYLVLFSATFLLEGFTGLAITAGAVITLFVMMQITGRTRWGARPSAPPGGPAPGGSQPATF